MPVSRKTKNIKKSSKLRKSKSRKYKKNKTRKNIRKAKGGANANEDCQMYETRAEFREAMLEFDDNLDLLIGREVRFYIKPNPNADGIFMNGVIIAVAQGFIQPGFDVPVQPLPDFSFRIRVLNQNDINKLSQDLQNENNGAGLLISHENLCRIQRNVQA
jgi:hypothetical protein